MMHKLNIKIPIYNCTVHVIIDEGIEKVINRYIKKHKICEDLIIPEGDEVHGYVLTKRDVTNYFVFYSIKSLTVTYLTHEISHVVDDILQEKNIEQNGEARCYLTGYISQQIFDFVIRKNIFINKYFPKVEEIKPKIKEDEEQQSGLL